MKLSPNPGPRAGMILPVCTAVLLCAAGCTRKTELPLPPGAYVPDGGYSPMEFVEPLPPPPPANAVQTPEIIAPLETVEPVDADLFPELKPTPPQEIEDFPEPVPAKPAPAKPAPAKPLPPKSVFPPRPGEKIHIVKKGDTLGGIAYRNKVNPLALAEYNGIPKSGILRIGDKIRIPAPAAPPAVSKVIPAVAAASAGLAASGIVYAVKADDTLSEIAERHNVRTADIVTLNKLDAKKPIYPGQKLQIPANPGTTAKPAPKAKPAPVKPAPEVKPAPVKPAPEVKPAPVKPAPVKPAPEVKPAPVKPAPEAETPVSGDAEAAPERVVSPTPAPEQEIDESVVITLNVDREMTLEEAAKAFDRPYATVKKLNPTISEDTRLKAGAAVRIPIF